MFIRKSNHKEKIKCKNKEIKKLEHKLDEEMKISIERMHEIEALKNKNNQLKQLISGHFTYDDLQEILSCRLDWYNDRIKRCKGLYTDAYIENLLVQRDELENVFEIIINKYHEKVVDNDG